MAWVFDVILRSGFREKRSSALKVSSKNFSIEEDLMLIHLEKLHGVVGGKKCQDAQN